MSEQSHPLPPTNRHTQRVRRQRKKKKFRAWLADQNKPQTDYELLMRVPPHRRFHKGERE